MISFRKNCPKCIFFVVNEKRRGRRRHIFFQHLYVLNTVYIIIICSIDINCVLFRTEKTVATGCEFTRFIFTQLNYTLHFVIIFVCFSSPKLLFKVLDLRIAEIVCQFDHCKERERERER